MVFNVMIGRSNEAKAYVAASSCWLIGMLRGVSAQSSFAPRISIRQRATACNRRTRTVDFQPSPPGMRYEILFALKAVKPVGRLEGGGIEVITSSTNCIVSTKRINVRSDAAWEICDKGLNTSRDMESLSPLGFGRRHETASSVRTIWGLEGAKNCSVVAT